MIKLDCMDSLIHFIYVFTMFQFIYPFSFFFVHVLCYFSLIREIRAGAFSQLSRFTELCLGFNNFCWQSLDYPMCRSSGCMVTSLIASWFPLPLLRSTLGSYMAWTFSQLNRCTWQSEISRLENTSFCGLSFMQKLYAIGKENNDPVKITTPYRPKNSLYVFLGRFEISPSCHLIRCTW